MVSDSRLPADLIPACMDVLLKLSSGERDFARVIVEVVQNVREDASNLDRAASAFPSEAEEEEDDDDLDLETATAEDIAEAHQRKLEKAAKKMQNRQLDPEKKDTYLRCLLLARALLERVVGVSAFALAVCHSWLTPYLCSKHCFKTTKL